GTRRERSRAAPSRPSSSRGRTPRSTAMRALQAPTGTLRAAALSSCLLRFDLDRVFLRERADCGAALLGERGIDPVVLDHALDRFEVGRLRLRDRFESHRAPALFRPEGAPFACGAGLELARKLRAVALHEILARAVLEQAQVGLAVPRRAGVQR